MTEKKLSKSTTVYTKQKKSKRDMSYTQNRELSWLAFNKRVMDEGMDERVPLLERYKFLAIFTSNLDEFFRVRVGSLLNLSEYDPKATDNKTGWTAHEQLDHIFEALIPLYAQRDEAYEILASRLAKKGLAQRKIEDLNEREAAFLEAYYETNILPLVSPLIIDARHPFPHLLNGSLYVFGDVKDAKDKSFFGLIAVPDMVSPLIYLPGDSGFILLEDLILSKAASVLPDFKLNNMAVISITRNADIDLDEGIDELEGNLRTAMKKAILKRNRLAPVRLEVQGKLSKSAIKFLLNHHGLHEKQVFYCKAPIRMKYVYSLEDKLSPKDKDKLCYRPFKSQPSPLFHPDHNIFDQIFEGDKLLHYPYESMDPFLTMLKEASSDPTVISISITIYRMASVSKVAEYLAHAAENGKNVLVLMELRARFDEENNIDYSERLEQAGCSIIYGLEDYKVHSKICNITLYRDGQLKTITQIGTGNYNEKTAKQYTDLSYFTADPVVGEDATNFFKNMLISKLDGSYDKLLVAPNGIKPKIMSLLDREILRAKRGERAEVIFKCNSVTERDLLDKMAEASRVGVKITLIVRGICCILPGIEGKTDNIRVISIVGRFLEHHRIYCFGANREDIYISSADLMTRNLVNRVEIAVPIQDSLIRQEISHILDIFLADNEKAMELCPDGSYKRVEGPSAIGAQEYFIKEAEDRAGRRREELDNSSADGVADWPAEEAGVGVAGAGGSGEAVYEQDDSGADDELLEESTSGRDGMGIGDRIRVDQNGPSIIDGSQAFSDRAKSDEPEVYDRNQENSGLDENKKPGLLARIMKFFGF